MYVCLVDVFVAGAFANRHIKAGELICQIPGVMMTENNVADSNSKYMFGMCILKRADDWVDTQQISMWYDALAFQGVPIAPDRVGHFVNTTDVSMHPPFHKATAVYDVVELQCDDGSTKKCMVVAAKRDMNKGEEVLVDYHWHLAIDKEYLRGRKYPCTCSHCKGMSAVLYYYKLI